MICAAAPRCSVQRSIGLYEMEREWYASNRSENFLSIISHKVSDASLQRTTTVLFLDRVLKSVILSNLGLFLSWSIQTYLN